MLEVGNVLTSKIANDKAYEFITSIQGTSLTLYLDKSHVPPLYIVTSANIVVATILAQSPQMYLSITAKESE